MIRVQAMPRIAIVADCGGEVGWGHVVRCHALAGELRARGCLVELLVNGEPPAFAPPDTIVATGEPVGSIASLAQALDGADAVVLDLWHSTSSTRDGLPGAPFVVAFVDGVEAPFACDLTVDSNVSSEASTTASCLAGGEHVILRPQFDPANVQEAVRSPGTLLVSFGGTERGELLSLVLEAAVPTGRQITAVAPSFPAGARASMPTVSWRKPVHEMGELLLEAEVAVISAGALVHEACATGLPCAVVALTEDQAREAEALADRGAILYLGPVSELSGVNVQAALARLDDRSLRARLSARGRELVDGLGRGRVADAILNRLAERQGL